tara:strand:- start:1290 stop:3344 length:2055 start_codon:yes stop_codon:yes gene_type:complete
LADEIKDFFELTYTKPGRMSAGMTCSIVVTFDPKINQDIISTIPMLAQTGPFEIPLICTTKKIVPSISVKLLALGTVVLGEQIVGKIRVRNDGALPTKYKIQQPVGVPTTDEFEFDAETDELVNQSPPPGVAQPDVLVYQVEGDVKPYSYVDVVLTFRPRQPGTLGRVLEFEFEGSDIIERCNVEATALRIPIYVEARLIDLKCCVANKLYRSAVQVKNRGTIALKMNFNMVDEFIGTEELSFSPPMCFIQAKDSSTGDPGLFNVQMKFRPSEKTLQRLKSKYVDKEANGGDDTIIVVPLTIDVSGQVLDVIFRMKAKLTTSDITFDPPNLNFGPCYTDRTVSYPISITNNSALPQKFGFVKLPREISVPYQDGFGTLLPYETIERDILFSPLSAVDSNFSLTFSTYMNRTFNIQCKGSGVRPPLKFSCTKIQFSCTPTSELITQNIFVQNQSKYEQMFEFGTPLLKLSGLTISPQCTLLPPGKTIRVEVVFDPALVEVETITYEYDSDDVQEENAQGFAEGDVDEKKEETKEEGKEEEGKNKDKDKEKNAKKKGGKKEEEKEEETEEKETVVVPKLVKINMPPTHEASFQQSKHNEPGSYHAQFNIPCFIKETQLRNSPRSPRSARNTQMLQPVQTIEVHTTTLKSKKLNAVVPADTISKLTQSSASRLDFGQMAVGQEEIAP